MMLARDLDYVAPDLAQSLLERATDRAQMLTALRLRGEREARL